MHCLVVCDVWYVRYGRKGVRGWVACVYLHVWSFSAAITVDLENRGRTVFRGLKGKLEMRGLGKVT